VITMLKAKNVKENDVTFKENVHGSINYRATSMRTSS
jgi:hypothetical protein